MRSPHAPHGSECHARCMTVTNRAMPKEVQPSLIHSSCTQLTKGAAAAALSLPPMTRCCMKALENPRAAHMWDSSTSGYSLPTRVTTSRHSCDTSSTLDLSTDTSRFCRCRASLNAECAMRSTYSGTITKCEHVLADWLAVPHSMQCLGIALLQVVFPSHLWL